MSSQTPRAPGRRPRTTQTQTTPESTGAGLHAGASERQPPSSIDAERALLGAMLTDEHAISEAISTLGEIASSVFWSERHQRIYNLLIDLWNRRGPIDSVVLTEAAMRERIFDEVGGVEYLAELLSSVPHAGRVKHYAQVVRDKHLLRQLIAAAYRIAALSFDQESEPHEILDQAEKLIFEITERRVQAQAETLIKEINDLFRRIQDRSPAVGLPTGYTRLDEMTSGLHPSELIIIAGRPSMGKTALGLNIAEHMALNENLPVLFFSLEMSREALAERILCSRARVNAGRLRKARTDQRDFERLTDAAAFVQGKPLLVDDSPGLTILELRARARIAKRKHDIQAIFVDYLQLMHAPGRESRQIEVSEISRGLKALAKDLKVPVIAMAQLNRNPEDRTRNRPRMSDLRESGAIEQDADVIMLLHRESYYRDKAASPSPDAPSGPDDAIEDLKAEVIIDKQRNGPTGVVELLFDKRFTRFENFNPTDLARYANTPEALRTTDSAPPF